MQLFFTFYHMYLILDHNIEANGGNDACDSISQHKDLLAAPQRDL